ncbi:MAG: ABC transporter substrate-binding protein [Clostridia bacterium]|nr:ABC transporter substrate-binding protein [Clostridia bacterium]
MKNLFKKTTSAFLVLAMLASCALLLVSCSEKNYAEDNTVIKIAASGPLTGDAAVYGKAVENSARLAVKEINAAGGLDGIMFEFVMADDKHDPTLVATNYASLYEGGAQITLGTVTTGPALEFKELSKDDNVFVLTPSASGDAVPEYDNAFQMCFADSNQGTASANYFNEYYQGKKVGVFYKSDDEYSSGIYNKFKDALDDSFGTVVEASFKEKENQFATQVNLLKECDIIFMPIYYTPASQFMEAGKDIIKADAIYFGCDGLDGIDTVKNFDITTVPQEVSYLSHFNSGATEGAAAAYIASYRAEYGEDAPMNQFGAAAYDCVYAIFEALKAAKADGKEFKVNTSASDFCDILKEVFTDDDFVFHGVTGAPEENGKSNISWFDDGTVNKEAVKYIVKEANAN